MAVDLSNPALGTPEWWLKKLLKSLQDQRTHCAEYQKFFEGDQPMAFASQKFTQVFGSRYRNLPANLMPLVVDADAERLAVQGFRFGGDSADKGAWKIWQDNQMDAESQIAHEIALVKGQAFVMVTPGPTITIEDPSEVVLATSATNRRNRIAALKQWQGDDGYIYVYLYLPDLIYKYRSEKPSEDATLESVKLDPYIEIGETDHPVRNPMGAVPFVPLLNLPDRKGQGRSEIAPVMGNQNAVNKLRFDALVASEFVAFPQRWAINIDVPTDPDTGKEVAPFRPGVDVLWVVRRPTADEQIEYADKVPTPSVGQFDAADLSPYIRMIREEIGEMSSISRTPYHYLLGEPAAVPPSGESIKSSEAPLVKKVERQQIHFGEGWEEVMRLALTQAGQAKKARNDGETIWADPETRNEAARTDSVMKQFQIGLIPETVALEQLNYSQAAIERIQTLKAKEAAKEAAAGGTTPTDPNAPPVADNSGTSTSSAVVDSYPTV